MSSLCDTMPSMAGKRRQKATDPGAAKKPAEGRRSLILRLPPPLADRLAAHLDSRKPKVGQNAFIEWAIEKALDEIDAGSVRDDG